VHVQAARESFVGSRLWPSWPSHLRNLSSVLLLLLAVFATGVSPAHAGTTITRPLLFSFDGSGTPQGSFSGDPGHGVAVDESTGNIYVNDRGHHLVDVFDSSGSFLRQIDGANTPDGVFGGPTNNAVDLFDIAVDNTGGPAAGNVYVTDAFPPSFVNVFDSAGNFLYRIDGSANENGSSDFRPAGLAIGANGNLIISQGPFGYTGHIYQYTTTASSATFLSQIDDETLKNTINSFAIDATGNFYVVNPAGVVEKRDAATGVVLSTYPGIAHGTGSLAVDRTGEVLFVGEGRSISEYSLAGVLIRRFAGVIDATDGMAIDESTNRLVVLDPERKRVDLYGPPEAATVPDVSLGTTTPGYFEAGLSGTINPDGAPGAYRFEYRVHGTADWKTTPLQPVGEGSADVPISTNLPGLIQNTEYDLRLVGVETDSGAIATSAAKTFKTNAVPLPTISAATGVTTNSATLHGSVNPQGAQAGWHFEYSKDGSNWTNAPATDQNPGTGSSDVAVETLLNGLDPNTKYLARLTITYLGGKGGSATSAQTSFTTGAEAPVISLLEASPITDSAATLRAYIDDRNSATTYYFEYGPDESYGTTVPLGEDGDAGDQLGPEGVLEQISGLEPETTYHFRVTATNQAGTVHSDDASFTTRATAEMNWPARGLELVNEPDKGNQNTILVREEPSSEGGMLGVPGINRAGNRSAWLTFSGAPGSTTGAAAPFLSERTETGWVTRPLTPAAQEQPGEGMREYERPVAATPDLSTFAFITTQGVLGAAENALVRVETQGGVLRHQIIDVLPPALEAGYGFGPGTSLAADGTLIYGKGTGLGPGQVVKGEEIFIVRADGVAQELPTPACEATLLAGAKESFSRLLLLSAGDTNCNGPKQLYSLEPGSGALELISGPPASGPAATADYNGVRISDDGSTVIYRTATGLSEDDTNGVNDLYRWHPDTGNECLTCAAGGLPSSSTHTSKDLSHIYIKTASQLVPGTPGGLYAWHDGEIHFISPNPNAKMDLLTPDGRTMVFWAGVKGITADRLDACRNRDPSDTKDISHESTNPCSQLYLYSEARGTIECISCPDEPQEAAVQPHLGGGFGVINYALSEDGQTVGFVTEAALSPRDINNTLDVYEWHNGSVRLVTNGASEWPESLFARPQIGGISADGRDLEIAVGGAALSGHEADGFVNVYDARVGGGFAVELPPAPCVEDACQGPLQSPPPLSNPGSAGFDGQGNARARHAKHRKAKHKKKHSRHSKQRRGANHNRGGAK
jgi:hypothetical protein